MLPAFVSAESLDWMVWSGLAGLLLVATIAGFWAGVMCAPALQELAVQRATKHVERLYEMTAKELERAGRLCQLLGSCATAPLGDLQWKRLDDSRHQLADAWKTLSDRQATHGPPTDAACVTGPTTFAVDWQRTPVEPATHLPDRTAFDANLTRMLAVAADHCAPCGVLLVRIDKSDQLAARYGQPAVASLQSKAASVVIKSTRDEDLVCRLGNDLFGILMPAVSPIAGARIAETIRAAVRGHSFQLEEAGPAVLVTASFGYSACLPHDPATLVMDRAGEALNRSQSTGRNQLHVHDATSRALSRIG